MDQHIIILLLAVVILALSLSLAVPSMMKKEGYVIQPWPISSMSAKQVSQELTHNSTCAADVADYCKFAKHARSQPNMLAGKHVAPALLKAMKSCGGDFPINGACAERDPMFQIPAGSFLLGGTHENKFGPF